MAEALELQEVKQRLHANGPNAACDDLKAFMKVARDCGIRESMSVASSGLRLLGKFQSNLTEDEKWAIHEQVVEAALDCGNVHWAQLLVNAVLRRFPDSIRAKRMKGMLFEGSGNYDAAEDVYTRMSKDQVGATMGLKRLVALERTKGNLNAALDGLRKYLATYSNDKSAWEELADLYLEVGMYRQAAFCYEELLMHAPTTTAYHIRYADILYTMGGANNIKGAKAYYSEAVVLSGGRSLRALYGLSLCSAYDKDAEGSELSTSAAAMLEELYRVHQPGKAALAKAITSA